MKHNFPKSLAAVLKHEGGYVNHPRDPGGATNKGVTIGTLRRLGIDVDGDGDSDIADLKALRPADLERVYKTFYWDVVGGDALPDGIDYLTFDFGVNSGPVRAVQHLQRAVGALPDGHMGPKTLALVAKASPIDVIRKVTESRMAFLRGLKTWNDFKNGWTQRVADVRLMASLMASPVTPNPVDVTEPPVQAHQTFWLRFLAWLGSKS